MESLPRTGPVHDAAVQHLIHLGIRDESETSGANKLGAAIRDYILEPYKWSNRTINPPSFSSLDPYQKKDSLPVQADLSTPPELGNNAPRRQGGADELSKGAVGGSSDLSPRFLGPPSMLITLPNHDHSAPEQVLLSPTTHGAGEHTRFSNLPQLQLRNDRKSARDIGLS